ncbi:hypothetical protein Tco_0530747 [Tanacetum coccineum]
MKRNSVPHPATVICGDIDAGEHHLQKDQALVPDLASSFLSFLTNCLVFQMIPLLGPVPFGSNIELAVPLVEHISQVSPFSFVSEACSLNASRTSLLEIEAAAQSFVKRPATYSAEQLLLREAPPQLPLLGGSPPLLRWFGFTTPPADGGSPPADGGSPPPPSAH